MLRRGERLGKSGRRCTLGRDQVDIARTEVAQARADVEAIQARLATAEESAAAAASQIEDALAEKRAAEKKLAQAVWTSSLRALVAMATLTRRFEAVPCARRAPPTTAQRHAKGYGKTAARRGRRGVCGDNVASCTQHVACARGLVVGVVGSGGGDATKG